ncbi:hypothetical protein F4778DRAFT_744733 [Xylariomycetidae sp. FL2044]|nr:hypothetical protein F4778DRAFT_767449 [Xylariomycetidae sp. FL2044]KAH9897204.1 hypothetical protein F4778DRAFT_744733 [Xylariomycetidae sp. FL2044]
MAVTNKPLIVVFPLVLSIAAFVLSMIALFAGTGPQQKALEEYHIVAINMSNFGHDLLEAATTTSSSPEATATSDDSLWDKVTDGLEDFGDDVRDKIEDEINDIANDAADELAEALGISQWYSLHVMNWCEGVFSPNATDPNSWYNTTNCTAQQPGVKFNLTDIIIDALNSSDDPLAQFAAQQDLQLPEKVQDAVDYLNGFLLAVFVFYVLGAGFCGLSFLVCIVVLTVSSNPVSRLVILGNIVLSALAVLVLLVGSAIATGISKKGVSEINSAGEDYGISAIEGTKFMIISWVAFGCMLLATVTWSFACCLGRRRTSGTSGYYPEKRHRTSHDSGRGLLNRILRRN